MQERKREFESPDSWSNDEDLMKPSPTKANKKKLGGGSKKLFAANGSDDSDFGSTVAKEKSKKPSFDKQPQPKKAKVNKPKVLSKKKSKKNAFGDSSEDASGSDTNFDISDVGPARDRPGRTKTVSKYNFGSDSDEFE